MQLISFSLTEAQFVDGSKSVTRRLGWLKLKAGDRLQACRKVMGRKKGEPLVRLGEIEVVSVRREKLNKMINERDYGYTEVRREGFRNVWQFGAEIVHRHFGSVLFPTTATVTPEMFVKFFCLSHKGCTPETIITRIEFKKL